MASGGDGSSRTVDGQVARRRDEKELGALRSRYAWRPKPKEAGGAGGGRGVLTVLRRVVSPAPPAPSLAHTPPSKDPRIPGLLLVGLFSPVVMVFSVRVSCAFRLSSCVWRMWTTTGRRTRHAH